MAADSDAQLARIERTLDGERLIPDVVTKYKMAGDIAGKALQQIIGLAGVGANVAQLCAFGDQYITEELAKVFNRGQVEKGIAFPTCVSLNETVANASPLEDEPPIYLKEGDVLKINAGVHLDGYIALAGATHVLPLAGGVRVSGGAANAVSAAYVGAELVKRMLRPGTKSEHIVAALAKVAAHFGCSGVDDSFSVEMKRFVMEGDKIIANAPSDIARSGLPFVVAVDEVYDVNVCMVHGSTGEVKESALRVNVYQRNVSQRYGLKLKAARALYNAVSERFPTLPFSTRHFARRELLGLKECVEHGLLNPHPVQRAGGVVGQARFTVLVTPARNLVLTTLPLPAVDSAIRVEPIHWASFETFDAPAAVVGEGSGSVAGGAGGSAGALASRLQTVLALEEK